MSEPQLPVLIADDQRDVLEALRLLLKSEHQTCRAFGDPASALAAVRNTQFSAALIDLNYTRDTTSGAEGLELLKALKRADPDLPVVAMTAWGSIHLAVEAMRLGAGDFIEKPWDNTRLISVLRNQIALGAAVRREQRLRAENRLLREDGDEEFIAGSIAMQKVMSLIDRVAPTDANVLVLGENGTGKGVVARLIHRRSKRADAALVKVNMGGIADSVFEAEMFGHVRGAFTDARADRPGRFEHANGGTLFLDEIGELNRGDQVKLLRVLQDQRYLPVGASRAEQADVRVLSATNVDVQSEVAQGRFREDLLYRLNTVEVRLPPLRERREDIPLLAAHFLDRQAARYGRRVTLAPDAMTALLEHPWPGNVRELEHVVERALLLCAGDVVHAADLLLGAGGAARSGDSGGRLDDLTLDEAERYLIQRALDRYAGNVSDAARALGLSRSAFYRRLAHHGLKGHG